MKFRFIFALVLCLIISTTVMANESVVRIPIGLDPKTIDPNLVFSTTSSEVVDQLFQPLVRFNFDKNEIVPAMAESWETSEDGLLWRFHLRKDVKWTDGKPVTANDVEYGLKRIVDPKTASPLANFFYVVKNAQKVNTGQLKDLSLVGVRAIDDYTVEFTLEYSAGYFLPALTAINLAAPKWTIEKYGDKWTEPENIVTNGAYKLQSWAHYNEIVLVKNNDYYNAENVQIEKAIYIYVKDVSTAMSMYLAGELDTASVPPVDIDRVKSDPDLSKEYNHGPLAILGSTQINSEYPPFDNPLVRKAFAASVDKEILVKYVLKGGQVPAYTVTPPGCFGHISKDEGVGIPFDPEQAKKYLAEAGYPDGKGLPEISYAFGSSDFNRNLAQALQQMWKDYLGVDVKLKSMEERIYWSTVCEGAHQMWRMGNAADVPDAHGFLYMIFHPEYGEKNLRWVNEEYVSLIENAAEETDMKKRKALYKRAEEIIVEEDCALMPLYYYAYNNLTKPYLHRTYTPNRRYLLEDWSIEN